MSDIQLKAEIEGLVKRSGYKKSKHLLCPVVKVISMRYKDVSEKQIYKVAKKIL